MFVLKKSWQTLLRNSLITHSRNLWNWSVGKTALMMKLVWDSIEKDPNRFNHYIILTSKGDEQGTLILLPGNINSRGKFDERNTIAKYFNSYSDFINNIAVINRSYDPENDHIGTEKLTNLAIEAMASNQVYLLWTILRILKTGIVILNTSRISSISLTKSKNLEVESS